MHIRISDAHGRFSLTFSGRDAVPFTALLAVLEEQDRSPCVFGAHILERRKICWMEERSTPAAEEDFILEPRGGAHIHRAITAFWYAHGFSSD